METKNSDFTQLCVWPSTKIGDNKPEDFEKFILDTFGVRAKFDSVQITKADRSGPGGRSDLFFYIHNDDVGKFSVPRLQYGIKWWEDVVLNKSHRVYNTKFIEIHPVTWK